MHTNQQTTFAKNAFVVFIDIIARKGIYLFYYEIPPPQIKIADAEVHTFYTHIGNNTL